MRSALVLPTGPGSQRSGSGQFSVEDCAKPGGTRSDRQSARAVVRESKRWHCRSTCGCAGG